MQSLGERRIEAASSLSSGMLEAFRHVASLVEGAPPGERGKREVAQFKWREEFGDLRERVAERYALVSCFSGRAQPPG